jgi:hypothetical protein
MTTEQKKPYDDQALESRNIYFKKMEQYKIDYP